VEKLLLLVNVRKVGAFSQTEIRTGKWLVLESSPSEAETAIAKLKKYKSPGSEQIPAP
jgi:hypothetical protein